VRGIPVGELPAFALRFAALTWLLLAGACTPDWAMYDKPGLTYGEWRRDDAECRQAALTAGSSVSHADAYGRCMRARGYHVGDR
jgi:hypothetical protein